MTFHPKIDYRELHRSKRQMPFDDGKPFAYTPENRERFEAIAKRYPDNPIGRRSAILPALYLVQRQIGYISLSAIPHVAGVIGCSAADVEDVVSFYTMFYTRGWGWLGMILATVVVVVSILLDVAYAFADPRIRRS